jgi:hypothetical protein
LVFLGPTLRSASTAVGTESAGRLDRGLARLALELTPADPHRLTIRVDYLRK